MPACQYGPLPPRNSGWRKPRQRLHNRAPRFTRQNQLNTGPRQPEEPTHMAHLQTHDNDVGPQVKPTHTATDLIILDVEPIPPCSSHR